MEPIKRVLFVGSKQLGLRVLETMHALDPNKLIGILTLDDTQDTRTKHADFQAFAHKNNLPLHTAKNRKHSEQIIQELNPDLCFVVGWYWIIGTETLTSVPHGFIGIHNSLLPKYRGSAPLIWPILRGEKEVGFSLFSFTEGMDDGPVWAQGSIAVGDEDAIANVLAKLEDRAVEVVQQTYPPILDGSLTPTEQDHAQATYCAQRIPQDGRIDWTQPAQNIVDFIRAQSDPYPGAFTLMGDKKMTVWKARLFPRPYIGTPGQIAQINGDSVYVIGGDDHALVLEEVEIDGTRAAPTAFIKSLKIRLGPE